MQAHGWRALFAAHVRFFLDVPEQTRSLVKQRKRWSSGGIYVLFSKGPRLWRHPIRNWQMMPVITDYAISVVWSVFYWISMALFLLSQLFFALTQDWERFRHNWDMVGIFVAIEMVVGVAQLTVASYYNDRGRTLKYVFFAPWYMLIYWMVNTYTVVVELIPTLAKVWSMRDGGTWKSPERSASLTGPSRGGRP